MMDALRDPVWQFVGVLVTLVAAAIPAFVWVMRRRRPPTHAEQQAALRDVYSRYPGPAMPDRGKHKKRKSDGILVANISSDFLNQFPVPVGALAAHVDRTYTPENFGSSDWLSVFRRIAAEGYLVVVDGTAACRLMLATPVNPGPKMTAWLSSSAARKRSIMGLDDE